MKAIFAVVTMWGAFASAGTCQDFSGVYFDGESAFQNCVTVRQTGCESQEHTYDFGFMDPVSVKFITDGIPRRYEADPSSQKTLSYDSEGRLVLDSVDDDGSRLHSIYEKAGNGDMSVEGKHISPEGESAPVRAIFRLMPSYEACRALLDQE